MFLLNLLEPSLVNTQHLLGDVLVVGTLLGTHPVLVTAVVEHCHFAFGFHEVDVDVAVHLAEDGA